MAVEGETETHPNVAAVRAIPRCVVALGFVSLFMDISSEIIHSLLPVFLVTVLGAGALSVGFIEGIAEATSQVTKLFFRRNQRLDRQTKAPGFIRLRACSAGQTLVPARPRCRHGPRRSFYRPDRQGYSGCTARCADWRRDAHRVARNRFWPAPSDGHGGRIRWSTACHLADGSQQRQLPASVLDRGCPCRRLSPADPLWSAGAGCPAKDGEPCWGGRPPTASAVPDCGCLQRQPTGAVR